MNIEENLKRLLTKEELRMAEPLSNHTTFRIGGPADYYAVPKDIETLKKLIECCRENNISYYILGRGSNVLFGDGGFRGVIIEVGKNLEQVEFLPEGKVRAQAGISLSKLAAALAERGLGGFEFASGIPGSLGGGITMNAGAYGGEMKDCLLEATVLDQSGNIQTLASKDLKLSYRHSTVMEEGHIVLEAVLQFTPGDQDAIRAQMKELNGRRKEKQPLEYPSAGSTFKRPEGYFAGKLIQDAGLCGYSVGGAQVSEKHCGFVINRQSATAEDVQALIKDVQTIVKDKFGVTMEPEVRMVGQFNKVRS